MASVRYPSASARKPISANSSLYFTLEHGSRESQAVSSIRTPTATPPCSAMGVVAELGRLATAAWSPGGVGAGYIAAGTYAGAVDPSFASASALELVHVDIQRSRLSVASATCVSDKFCCIDWGLTSRTYPAGLIAGGLSDGTVRVWDAALLIRSPTPTEDENKAVLFGSSAALKKHAGPVRGIGFNPFLPTRLATGGADGQVLIWDLSNPAAGAVVHPPAKVAAVSPGAAPKDEVTALAWNRKIQHILASGTGSGFVNVWDLKQRKQVIGIRNPSGRMRCSALTWHPDIATQVLVSCDQNSGSALWDLRNATAPVMTYDHHNPEGVSSATWCPHDTEMLLTSSRDSRTTVVSVSTGEVITETPRSSSWNFDVKWSPRVPGLYLASSFDGRLSVNSLMTATTAPAVSSETANALAESFGEMAGGFEGGVTVKSPRAAEDKGESIIVTRPPIWMRKPVSISFGVGGMAATVTAKGGTVVTVAPSSRPLPGLRESAASLDGLLVGVTSADPSPALTLCNEACSSAVDSKDKLAWQVLGLMFQTDSRRKVLKFLGYDVRPLDVVDDIAVPVYGLERSAPLAVPVRPIPSVNPESVIASTTGLAENNVMDGDSSAMNAVANGAADLSLTGPAPWDVDNDGAGDADGGDNILDGDDAAMGNGSPRVSDKSAGVSIGNGAFGKDSLEGLDRAGIDDLVRRALIVGDFEKAVDACLHAGRTADALIVAHAGGPDLWLRTQAEYIATSNASSGSNVVGAIAGPRNKMDEFIRESADNGKELWKEALAVLLTYTAGEELGESCSALGQRLLVKEDHSSALICFICAGNTRMATTAWMRQRPKSGTAAAAMASRVECLTALVRKVRMITAATLLSKGEHDIGSVRALDDVSGSVLFEYGALLMAQGDMDAAVTYLNNLDASVTGVFGSVEDMQAQSSECLAMLNASTTTTTDYNNGAESQRAVGASGFDQSGYGAYGNSGAAYPTSGYSDYAAPPPSANTGYGVMSPPQPTLAWGQSPAPVAPPAPPTFNSSPYETPSYGGVGSGMSGGGMSPVAPPPQAMPTPPRPSGVFATQSATSAANNYNPSAAYGNAPAYDTSSYSVAQPPPMSVAPPAPVTPMMPMGAPAQVSAAPSMITSPRGGNADVYAMAPSPMQPMMPSMSMQSMAAPPPPPPPPSDSAAPPPAPYHTKAVPGSGSHLPPSAEVAVAEQRRSKPLSSSGMPGGGPPRRSQSTSSSLSGMSGIEAALPIEKADVSKIPPTQQVIVKSLRGAYMYASKLNSSMMYKKKMDGISKSLGRLLAALNAGAVDAPIVELLVELGRYVEKANYDSASGVVSTLTKRHWDTNSSWIKALERLIDCVLRGH